MKRLLFTFALFTVGFAMAHAASGTVRLTAGNGGIFYEDVKATLTVNFNKGTWDDKVTIKNHYGERLDGIAELVQSRFIAHVNEASKGLEVVDNERLAEYRMVLTVNKLDSKWKPILSKSMKIWAKLDVYDKRTDKKVCTVTISEFAGKKGSLQEVEALGLSFDYLAYELFKVRVRP